MRIGLGVVVCVIVVGATAGAAAAAWSREYIRQLPDSAFAVVEWSLKGKPIRRLPHHDASGALDLPHLCNAISRLPQVKWRNPANAEIARQHLSEHMDQIGRGACRPTTSETDSPADWTAVAATAFGALPASWPTGS